MEIKQLKFSAELQFWHIHYITIPLSCQMSENCLQEFLIHPTSPNDKSNNTMVKDLHNDGDIPDEPYRLRCSILTHAKTMLPL